MRRPFSMILLRRHVERRPADGERARAEGPGAVGHRRRVALDDADLRERHAEARGEDLRERGRVALSVAVRAERRLHRARRVDAHLGRLEETGARAEGAGELRRRDAGRFDEAGDPDSAQDAARSRRVAPRGEPRVVGEHERTREDAREVAAVVGRPDRRLVRHGGGGHEVAAADLRPIDAECARGLVREALQHEAGLRPSGAAIRVRRHRGREHSRDRRVDRRRRIDARKQGGVDRARDRGADGRNVGAEVRQGLDAEAEEAAVRIERERAARDVVARLVVGDEALGARRHPAHRAAQPARRPRDDRLLGIVLALVAEAAADVGRDHSDRELGEAELLGDEPADEVGHLRGRVERERIPVGARERDRRARLDGAAGEPVVVELQFDGVRGLRERTLDRCGVAALPAEAHVARRVGVQLRCADRERIRRRGRRGQRLVIDLDELGGVERRAAALRQNDRHRLADVPHALARERPARRLGHRRAVVRADRPQRTHRPDAVRRHVGADEDRDDAGGGRRRTDVDRADARVRVRRAHDRAVQCIGNGEIGDELAAPREEAQVLLAEHPRPDPLVHCRSTRARSSASYTDRSVTRNRSAGPPVAVCETQVQ